MLSGLQEQLMKLIAKSWKTLMTLATAKSMLCDELGQIDMPVTRYQHVSAISAIQVRIHSKACISSGMYRPGNARWLYWVSHNSLPQWRPIELNWFAGSCIHVRWRCHQRNYFVIIDSWIVCSDCSLSYTKFFAWFATSQSAKHVAR